MNTITILLNKIKNINSFYFEQINKNLGLIIISFILATISTIITYPGLWYSDSYLRADICDKILDIFYGGKPLETDSYVTVFPSLLMAICKGLFGDYGIYTFIKSFLFLLITFCLIKKINTSYKKFQYIIFATSPLFLCASVWDAPSIGFLIGIGIIILVLTSPVKINFVDTIIDLTLLLLGSSLIFGYMLNSITVIPVILFYIFWKNKNSLFTNILKSIAIFIGIFIIFTIPGIARIKILPSYCAGFLWETLHSINTLNNEKYFNYFDDITQKGATLNTLFIEKKEQNHLNNIIFDSDLTLEKIDSYHCAKKIIHKYITFAKKEPTIFIKTKLEFVKRVLGINADLGISEINYNRWDKMSLYHFNDSKIRLHFTNIFKNFASEAFLLKKPWLMFLITLIFITNIKYKKNNFEIYWLIYIISIFYYMAFLITTHSFEIRYFYPAFYLMAIIDITFICDWINYVVYNDKN